MNLFTYFFAIVSFLFRFFLGGGRYLAPEYTQHGQVTNKLDVYSFGVVLLELVTGRKAIDITRPKGEQCLTEWVKKDQTYKKPTQFDLLVNTYIHTYTKFWRFCSKFCTNFFTRFADDVHKKNTEFLKSVLGLRRRDPCWRKRAPSRLTLVLIIGIQTWKFITCFMQLRVVFAVIRSNDQTCHRQVLWGFLHKFLLFCKNPKP